MKRPRTRGIRAARALLAAVTTAACYTWTPVEPGAVTPGQDVRVTLDRDETMRAADMLGELRTVVTGTVADRTGGELLALTLPAAGSGSLRFNEYVELRWAGIQAVEGKRFSAGRTAALAGVGVVATVAVLAVANNSGGGPNDNPGPNEQVRLPLFRFAW